MKANNLFLAFLIGRKCLQRTGPNRKHGTERITHAIEVFALFDRPASLDNFIQLVEVAIAETHWHTELKQAAFLAMGADIFQFYDAFLRHILSAGQVSVEGEIA